MLVCASSAFGDTCPKYTKVSSQVLFLVRQGRIEAAIDMYHDHTANLGQPDYALLQQIGVAILEHGSQSKDPEEQLMAVFGSGVAADDRTLHLMEKAVSSPHPQLRLVAIRLIAQRGSRRAQDILVKMLSSHEVLLRLEALLMLSQMHHPSALGQAEALMIKLPDAAKPLFAQIYAAIGDPQSVKQLRRLMIHADPETRIASVIAAAERGRDDLLPQIRQMLTHLDPMQQEACAAALGMFGDHSAVGRLETLTRSKHKHVRLAADIALHELGQSERRRDIEALAKDEYLLAVYALGEIEGSEDVLASLLNSRNIHVRINAALALLRRHDRRCIPFLADILIEDSRDLAFSKVTSHGHSLLAWKVVPGASAHLDGDPIAWELSTGLREAALEQALQLPESDFLDLAEMVLKSHQADMVPMATLLLENLASDEAIAMLKRYRHKIGAPLVRNYCNLALYRLGEPGTYSEQLYQWVYEQNRVELIRFRPMLPWELRNASDPHVLTPHDTSKLYLASVEALATRQDDQGASVILGLIRDGNPINRYALAGLLVRVAQ